MASWSTDNVTASLNARDIINTDHQSASDLFSSTTKKSINDVSSYFAQTSIVGINVNKVPEMKRAIQDYVSNVESKLNEGLTACDPKRAFQGQQAQALVTYIEEIKSVCGAICQKLNAFADDLTEVQKKYEERDASINAAINSDATNTSSKFQNYSSSAD